MRSIRTQIGYHTHHIFKDFCADNNLHGLHVGQYRPVEYYYTEGYICYAYSDSDTPIVETLTFLTLKHGSIDAAFRQYFNKRFKAFA